MPAGTWTLRIGAALVATLGVAGPASATQDLVKARLLSETGAIKPGGTAWMAVELAMKPGWHTYWRNPGDAGQPTDILWTLPLGYEAGGIAWPAPKSFSIEFITSYGYEDKVALLVPITAPATAKPGETATVTADVNWLACEKICIPGEAKLSVDLPIALDAPANADAKDVFDGARARMPRPAPGQAEGSATEDILTVALPAGLVAADGTPSGRDVMFMPFDDALIDHGAPQKLSQSGGAATLALKRGPKTGALSGAFPGLLLVKDKAAQRQTAYDLTVQVR